MTKQEMLDSIENAKKTHLEQMHKIRSVINGKKIENPTALSKRECECGIWFYSHEKVMKDILGAQLFERLDKNHEQWHVEYFNIYNIFFKKEQKKRGLLSKVLKRDKIDSLTIDKAKLYYSELERSTDELLKVSESASRRVAALKDAKFAALS